MMSGGMIFPPHDTKNDFAILFLETSGCLPMCGHGTIGIVTIALEKNLVKPKVEGILHRGACWGHSGNLPKKRQKSKLGRNSKC